MGPAGRLRVARRVFGRDKVLVIFRDRVACEGKLPREQAQILMKLMGEANFLWRCAFVRILVVRFAGVFLTEQVRKSAR